MTAATTTTVPFADAATFGLDTAKRQAADKLARLSLTAVALVDFIEWSAAEFVALATVEDLYTEALSRNADKPGRGPAWLSMKLGQLLNTGRTSNDKFYDATAAAKRDGALRVLREMRQYLDADKVLEYVV